VGAAAQSFAAQDLRPLKLLFQDEGRFGRSANPDNCWAPAGLRAQVKAQFIREYTHVFSAVCPKDGQSFSLILPYADTEAMQIFLKHLSRRFQRYRVVLVLDGAAWHRSQQLGAFANIRLLFQPAYSPEVNPVEHLWEHLREKYLRNYVWNTLEALETELVRILKEVSHSKKVIQSLVGFHWAIFNV
jgi:transposase